MSDNIFRIGFNVIKDNVKSDSLEDNFLIFDNFSDGSDVMGFMTATDYPVRLNTITIIAFCIDGYIKINLGLNQMTISKNQLCIISHDQIIQTTEVSPDFKAGFMVIRRYFFNSQNHFMEIINIHNNLIKKPYFALSENEMQEYIMIFDMIKKKIVERDNTYRLQIIQNYCEITFYNIYNLVLRDKDIPKETVQNNDSLIYEKFIKSVEEHYRKEHCVKFYADIICLTPKYLSSVIFDVSGKHASDWIHEYIILEAKALLKSTDMNLKDISDILNFCTPSHFGRFFKRYTGYTPSECKKL